MTELTNWDDIRIFLAIARHGTLTGAAAHLNSGIATVSRRIDRLESALGVPLFARHQSGYRLTDEGEMLLPKAEALEESARALDGEASVAAQATGRVRLATAENLANPVIIPSLPVLVARHPRLTIEINTDIRTANLHRRDADLAVRMVKPERGNVSLRRIGTLGFGLYGAPRYLAMRPDGSDLQTLDRDRFIAWSEPYAALPAARWLERRLRDRPPALVTSTLAAQVSAARAGMGLAVLPHFLGVEAGLRRLPHELEIDQAIWLVIHSDLTQSRRVRVVADHLARIIRSQSARLRDGLAVNEG